MIAEFDYKSDTMDAQENRDNDISEELDNSSEIDEMLDNMSLDELRELRDSLNGDDVYDTGEEVPDLSDLVPIDSDGVDPSDLAENTPDVSDLTQPDEKTASDYSFHWDGSATHNTEWDDPSEPTVRSKVLRR